MLRIVALAGSPMSVPGRAARIEMPISIAFPAGACTLSCRRPALQAVVKKSAAVPMLDLHALITGGLDPPEPSLTLRIPPQKTPL